MFAAFRRRESIDSTTHRAFRSVRQRTPHGLLEIPRPGHSRAGNITIHGVAGVSDANRVPDGDLSLRLVHLRVTHGINGECLLAQENRAGHCDNCQYAIHWDFSQGHVAVFYCAPPSVLLSVLVMPNERRVGRNRRGRYQVFGVLSKRDPDGRLRVRKSDAGTLGLTGVQMQRLPQAMHNYRFGDEAAGMLQ